MKQIREGTLHVAGHDCHLYGLCNSCLGVLHLGVLGPDYDGYYDEGKDEYQKVDPNEDIHLEYDLGEAYHFELVDNGGTLHAWVDPKKVTIPCRCELDRVHFEASL